YTVRHRVHGKLACRRIVGRGKEAVAMDVGSLCGISARDGLAWSRSGRCPAGVSGRHIQEASWRTEATLIRKVTARLGFLALLLCLGTALAAEPDLDVFALPDGRLRLSWTHEPPGYVVQESDSPGSSGPWRGILIDPVAEGLQRILTLPAGESPNPRFFRLRARGAFAGLDFLAATQNPDGLWDGSGA